MIAVSPGAFAQGAAPVVSQPVVQAVPGRDQLRLNAALSKLARDARNIEALVEAGDAARGMGDHEAAIGFYRRALQVSPKDARVKAGLAGALVQSGDPYAALPLFEEAEAAGAKLGVIAADKGLAYDLVGDPTTAQKYYQVSLVNGVNPEVRRRMAISQAIAGDRRAMEATLSPLLQQQDKAAWRARAFALAILGKTEEAAKITDTILPKSLAEGISPFLAYMPRLTAGQQAAAANLGRFPRASEIGREDPRLAQIARTAVPPPRLASLESALVPQGRPMVRETAPPVARTAAGSARTSRVAPPEPKPERTIAGEALAQPVAPSRPPAPAPTTIPATANAIPAPGFSSGVSRDPAPTASPAMTRTGQAAELPPRSAATSASASASAPAPVVSSAPREMAFTEPPKPATSAATSSGANSGAVPGFDLSSLPSAVMAASQGRQPVLASAMPVRPAAPALGSVADAFGDLGRPLAEAAAASGAVDIRTIRAARVEAEPRPSSAAEVRVQRGGKAQSAKPTPVAKPAPPSHPSRIWVQLGVGQNKDAIAYDWRKLLKQYPDVFRNRKISVSDMGRTNRMLVGPFASMKEANAFLATLKKTEIDGPHVWTSPAGQVVDAL